MQLRLHLLTWSFLQVISKNNPLSIVFFTLCLVVPARTFSGGAILKGLNAEPMAFHIETFTLVISVYYTSEYSFNRLARIWDNILKMRKSKKDLCIIPDLVKLLLVFQGIIHVLMKF